MLYTTVEVLNRVINVCAKVWFACVVMFLLSEHFLHLNDFSDILPWRFEQSRSYCIVHWKNRWIISTQFLVVLPEFQTTHLSSYSNPSNFWVIMPNYFAVNCNISYSVITTGFYTLLLFWLVIKFLNQARASLRLARAWFLKIDPVRIVCIRACVCVRARGY